MEFINLTKYPIIIECITILPGGYEARADCSRNGNNRININGRDIYIDCVTYDRIITGLPEPKPNIGYIVTEQVAKMTLDREDIFAVKDLKKSNNGFVYQGIFQVINLR